MKKKIFGLLILGVMVSINATSQTIKENIDKAARDKETKERAAKADVYIHKKTIYDSTQIINAPVKKVTKKPASTKMKIKQHKYKKKIRKS